jgi:hypothetical protein
MYWIAVASREHVLRGVAGNFCQVCHGKDAPLRRMKANDWLIYYSPTERFGEKEPCRRFTALGRVLPSEPYQHQMAPEFIPWRRDIAFLPVREVPIEPLIESLSFIQNKRSWGFPFRRGCFAIPANDFRAIACLLHDDPNALFIGE